MNTFTYGIYINTTPEKLWEALTSSEFTRQYWGGRTVESDWKEGSVLKSIQPMGERIIESEDKILISDHPKLLSYTFSGRQDIVTFQIIAVAPEEVKLVITHEGIDEKMKNMFVEGWYAILSSLKTLLETGKALDHSWWRG
jgi:uncharacterized protein YndB with AHSA1/START domain